MTTSEVLSFAQVDTNKGKGARGRDNKIGGNDKKYDKEYWKYK